MEKILVVELDDIRVSPPIFRCTEGDDGLVSQAGRWQSLPNHCGIKG